MLDEQASYTPVEPRVADKGVPLVINSGAGATTALAPGSAARAVTDAPVQQTATLSRSSPTYPTVTPKSAKLSMVSAGSAESPNGTGLDAAMLGPTYSASITSTGFTVPLPQGKWVVLARSTVKLPTASGMAYYLGQIENKRLVGAVKFFAAKSITSSGQGFPEAKACSQPNASRSYVYIEGRILPSEHQLCWIIQNYYSSGLQYWADRAANLPSLERAAGGDLSAKGVSFPQDLINVRFTLSDKSNFLEVDYLFSPETSGIKSHVVPAVQDSDWTAQNVQQYPEKLAYIAKMKVWGQAFWPHLKDAFSSAAGAGGQ